VHVDFTFYVLADRFPSFTSTANLFAAVVEQLRVEFVAAQGEAFNAALAVHSQLFGASTLYTSRMGSVRRRGRAVMY